MLVVAALLSAEAQLRGNGASLTRSRVIWSSRPQFPRRTIQSTDRKLMVSALDLAAPGKARSELQKGNKALSKGRWQQAQERFEKALSIYPSFPAAHNNLGVTLVRQGKDEPARRSFEEALRLEERYPDAYVNLASAWFRSGDLHRALALIEKALDLQPTSAEALTLVCNIRYRMGELEAAVESARRVHSLEHEGSAYAHFLAALALQQQRLTSEAATEFALYLEESPNGPNAQQARHMLRQLQARN